MLKKANRLTKKEFDNSFKQGKRLHTKNVQLIFDKNSADFHGAVVVGKKVYKKAVLRNLLRRRIYGLLYRFVKENNLSGTYILIAKPTAKNLSRNELKSEVLELLGQFK